MISKKLINFYYVMWLQTSATLLWSLFSLWRERRVTEEMTIRDLLQKKMGIEHAVFSIYNILW